MPRVTLALILLIFALPLAAAEKPRVFIVDNPSWKISGSSVSTSPHSATSDISGGEYSLRVEAMKNFGKRCPEVTVTNKREQADYVVLFGDD